MGCGFPRLLANAQAADQQVSAAWRLRGEFVGPCHRLPLQATQMHGHEQCLHAATTRLEVDRADAVYRHALGMPIHLPCSTRRASTWELDSGAPNGAWKLRLAYDGSAEAARRGDRQVGGHHQPCHMPDPHLAQRRYRTDADRGIKGPHELRAGLVNLIGQRVEGPHRPASRGSTARPDARVRRERRRRRDLGRRHAWRILLSAAMAVAGFGRLSWLTRWCVPSEGHAALWPVMW